MSEPPITRSKRGRGRGLIPQQSTSQNVPTETPSTPSQSTAMPPPIQPARVRHRRPTQQELDAAIRANSLHEDNSIRDFVDEDETAADTASDEDDEDYEEESDEDDEQEGTEHSAAVLKIILVLMVLSGAKIQLMHMIVCNTFTHDCITSI